MLNIVTKTLTFAGDRFKMPIDERFPCEARGVLIDGLRVVIPKFAAKCSSGRKFHATHKPRGASKMLSLDAQAELKNKRGIKGQEAKSGGEGQARRLFSHSLGVKKDIAVTHV